MASKTSICNRALEKLGGGYITNILDNSKEARALLRAYDSVRDATIRIHPWNFARKRASLPALSDAPVWGYARQFQMPADMLRLLETEYEEHTPYKIEGRKILTDQAAPLRIVYLYRCEDPNEYDALFIEAFACKLALEICEDITGSNSKKESIKADYGMAMAEARRIDGMEDQPEDLPDTPWLLSRR